MAERGKVTTSDGQQIAYQDGRFTYPCVDCGVLILVNPAKGGEQPHKCGDLMLRRTPQEQGTRWYIDGHGGVKPYHWAFNRRTGNLTLLRGPDPRELLTS